MKKKRILLVGDYNRSDFLHVAKELYLEADFFFIEYLNSHYLQNKEALQYGKVIYWKDYKDAYELLTEISPHKVLFYFIESFNHVALNVASKVTGIPTFHLEHGLRFSVAYYKEVNSDATTPSKMPFLRKVSQTRHIFDRIRNRLFFQRTARRSPLKEKLFLVNYYKVRSRNNIFDTFQKLKSDLRLPDQYIAFSPLIFKYHQELENLAESYPVTFIGVPQFDEFSRWSHLENAGSAILFIDQPLHEQSLYGWTLKEKKKFLIDLIGLLYLLKRKIYIKPHPFNDLAIYNDIPSSTFVEIMSSDWERVVPNIDTVMGFSSTLLLPFMAMDHIACFTLEMHPGKKKVPYSEFLLKSGVCHAVYSFEDLSKNLAALGKWHALQKPLKKEFIEKFLYKFDGNASIRLRRILFQ
jgi:hypothetical protein